MIIIEKDINKLIELCLNTNNVELEAIYGFNQSKLVNEETFLKVLDYCKKNFKFVDEDNTLDIRRKIIVKNRNLIGNIRCSINGIYNIQQYCKTNKIDDEVSMYVKKESIKDYPTIVDKQYNYRINLKTEKQLKSTDEVDVNSFKNNIETADKHYRFKKRYSFNFPNNLFRIDLTVVKSNKWNPVLKSYDFHKNFIESNILKNQEQYEIEIEFLGNNTSDGIKLVNDFIKYKIDSSDIGTDYQSLTPEYSYEEKKKRWLII